MPSKKTKKAGRIISGVRYNKGEFTKKWSEIINRNLRVPLSEDELYFIVDSLKSTPKYARIASDDRTKYKVTSKTFQKYPVKGLIVTSPNSQQEIWVGKQAIVDELYPKKKTQKGVSNLSNISKAMRQLVEEDMSRERELQRRYAFGEGIKRCPLSGVLLTECETTQLDHDYPFSLMIEDFFRLKSVTPEWLPYAKIGTSIYIKDEEFNREWVEYHRKNAKLQLTCGKANRAKSNKW